MGTCHSVLVERGAFSATQSNPDPTRRAWRWDRAFKQWAVGSWSWLIPGNSFTPSWSIELMLYCEHKPDFILISVSVFKLTLVYFCQGDITGLCFLTSFGTVSHKSTPDSCLCIWGSSVVCLLWRLQARGLTERSIVVWVFFLFPSISGKGKIGALLGATQQVMFQGQQIPVSLPSGTEESITGLGWRLIRRGSAWRAYQELDTKPFSVHLSPSHSKWEDICSGIQGNTSSVTPLSWLESHIKVQQIIYILYIHIYKRKVRAQVWTYKYIWIAPSLGLLQCSNLQRVCFSSNGSGSRLPHFTRVSFCPCKAAFGNYH